MKIHLRNTRGSSRDNRFFFFRDSFLFIKANSFFFEWVDDSNVIRIPFRKIGRQLNSLSFATFGGFQLSGNIRPDQLVEFLSGMERIVPDDTEQILIRTYPASYSPENWQLQHDALLSAGFKVKFSDTNMHLEVDGNSFRERLQPSENRYLNSAKREHWVFKKLDPGKFLTPAYELFLQARRLKNYPMTMELEELAEMYSIFPDEFLLFGVFRNDELIAASTCICISSDIIYDFYHGDAVKFRSKSPVIFLFSGLFSYAEMNGYKILDLGTCSNKGVRNENLCSFKRNIGGVTSPKITYEKVFKQ